jgi:pimeloyl-ACP methyl ester carboxylesterase
MAEAATAERNWTHWTEPSWVEVDGVNTAYRRKGSGEPLLFLHGAGLTRQWLPLFERLSERFDVVVPEHPGFGDTEMPAWLRGFDDLVLHYDSFVHELGLENPHLAGHSLGGWIAADLAVFYPRRFASMALISAMGLRVPESPQGDPFRWSPEVADEKLLNGTGEHYEEFLRMEGDIEQTLHEYGEAITFARLTWNPRYDFKLDRRLARVKIPTVVIHSADDAYIPLAHAERWVELIDGAKLEVLEGRDGKPASHLAIVQHPDALAELVAANAEAA